MFIELSLLPPAVAQKILQVQQGEVVQFTNNGQVVAKAVQEPQNFLDVIMNYNGSDVSDIDLPEFDRKIGNKFDDPFKDD